MLAWTVRSWRIVGSGGGGLSFGISGLTPKSTRSRRRPAAKKRGFSQLFQHVRLYGRALVRDEDGQITEKTKDYYAQDNKGNVWYFGEDTAEFENGKLVSTEGSWLAGVNGANPGIVMEAHPKVGDSYVQEDAAPVAENAAEVISLNGHAKVPFGNFNHLLVTHDTNLLEPDAPGENKYYAKGIGEVYAKDLETGEVDLLVSVKPPHGALQLVQAMAGFGASDPGLSTLSSTVAADDLNEHHVLAAHGHHHA